jgi:hypothetical protein
MYKNNKPDKKLTLTPSLFNSLYSMLIFFVATESRAGETEFSKNAVRLKAQIERYGKFIESENPENSRFVIHYFDKEVVQLLKLFNMYSLIREVSSANHFEQICADRKSKPRIKGCGNIPTSSEKNERVLGCP